MSARLSPRRRRVLLTADAVGGVWAYALDLARGLIRAGCEVHLLVLGPAPDVDQMAQARACPGLRLKAPALPLEWMATSAEAIDDASRALAGLVRDIDPDIVHLSNPALACSGEIEAPLVAVLHSCMATWWTTLRPATPMPADLHQRCDRIRRGLATAEAVIAPSRSFAALARATYPAVDPFVVRNGRAAPPAATGNAERSGVFAAGT